MTRYNRRNIPRVFAFVPSQKAIRRIIPQDDSNVILVEHSGLSYGETHYKKWRRELSVKVGLVEARVVNGQWRFYIRIEGIRKETIGNLRDAISECILKQIKDFIDETEREVPHEMQKPVQLNLEFKIDENQVIPMSRKVRWSGNAHSVSKEVFFNTGDWYIEKDDTKQ